MGKKWIEARLLDQWQVSTGLTPKQSTRLAIGLYLDHSEAKDPIYEMDKDAPDKTVYVDV